jgi:CHAT domain-containing protein/tetratricopeptide (TPR) repeat protein
VPPYKRRLTGVEAKQADGWEQKVGDLTAAGKYAEALAPARQVLALRTRRQGAKHWETIDADRTLQTLKKLADLDAKGREGLAAATRLEADAYQLFQQGRYSRAESLVRKALGIRARLFGHADWNTIALRNNLATALNSQGKWAEAEGLLRKAVGGCRRGLGEDHPDTATAYFNLARGLQIQGKYGQAEPLLLAALAVFRRAYGEAHHHTAMAYGGLAGNLNAQGKYAAAEQMHRRALAINLRRGDDVPTAIAYNNVAYTLYSQGKYEQAEPLARKALAIFRRLLRDKHPYTAVSIRGLASILEAQGQYEKSEPYLREALAICRQAYGDEHPETAIGYARLAQVREAEGKIPRAQELHRRALAIRREVLEEDHPDTVRNYLHLARVLHARGKYREAEKTAAKGARHFEAARLQVTFRGLDRAPFTAGHSPLTLLAALLARNGKPADAWQRLESSLARGLLDDLTARPALPLTGDERRLERQLSGQIHRLDRQIAGLLGAKDPTEEHREQAARLKEERGKLRARLSALGAALAKKYGPAAGQVYTLERLQPRLPENAALVAWVDREALPGAADPGGEHWACVVRKRGQPVWARLRGSGAKGAWTEDDSRLADQVRRLFETPPRDAAAKWSDRAGQLARQRLAPLARHLGAGNGLPPVKHLIVLPSPALRRIPVEALIEARADKQPPLTVSYAPSGTMFAWLQEQRRKPRGPARLLAVGDPAFVPPEKARPVPTAGDRDVEAVLERRRGPAFKPLPGSRREVLAIARLFPRAEKLLGSEASEERLNQFAKDGVLKGYRYIHLATHGQANAEQPLLSFLALAQDQLPDPLKQVLAGKPVSTGRLTAAHMLQDWRLDADLVVLSACETGLGQYQLGEGYLGFAQGLFLAGARSLVLSQWSVDDEATALLMVRFYENLLGSRKGTRPMSKAQALKEAKEWLRGLSAKEVANQVGALPRGTKVTVSRRPVAAKPFGHPYYWAGFILVGDPH